jgi:hypothetical protein
MKKNYVTFVVDASGSMFPFTQRVRTILRDLTNDIQTNSKQQGQQTKISFRFFNSDAGTGTTFAENPVIPWYYPNGNTALNDAIGETLKQHSRYKASLLGDIAHLIIVVTDGEENGSRVFTLSEIKSDIVRLQDKDNYTFAFNVPPGRKEAFERHYGVHPDNITEWEQSYEGTVETYTKNLGATQSYLTARSAGMTKSSSMYVTTDLSGIGKTQLNELDNFTQRLKSAVVPGETRIDEFVQKQTGQSYLPGTAFYQLTKPETIQQHKRLLIREKGKQIVYGGDKLKEFLGIPLFKDVKVNPGNHANYDLFVQSTSTNRKLVRGSTVLLVK